MLQRHRRASVSGYGRARDLDCLWKPQIVRLLFFGQKARSRLARHGEYQIGRRLVPRCSSTISLTTIYLIQLGHSNKSLSYLTSFTPQCANEQQTHSHLIVLIVSPFEGKDSRRDSIMSNQNSSSHDDYSIIKLEFERFDFFQDNNRPRNVDEDSCRQRDVDENDSLNTIRASTLHQQIKTLITKI